MPLPSFGNGCVREYLINHSCVLMEAMAQTHSHHKTQDSAQHGDKNEFNKRQMYEQQHCSTLVHLLLAN